MAGLLHNIGEPLLLGACSRHAGAAGPGVLPSFLHCVASCHEEMGQRLLAAWGLSGWLAALAGSHHRAPVVEQDEARRVRKTVLLAWTMALRTAFVYLPGQDIPDPAPLLESLGLESAQVDAIFGEASGWIS